MSVLVDAETGIVCFSLFIKDRDLAARLDGVPPEVIEADLVRLVRGLVSLSAQSGQPDASGSLQSVDEVGRVTESQATDAQGETRLEKQGRESDSAHSKVVHDATPKRRYDDGELFECDLWFEDSDQQTKVQMREIMEHWARVKHPLARIEFDGVVMTVVGRGYDKRCEFCRTARTVIRKELRVDVLKSDCPFEPDYGDNRPQPGEELVGFVVELLEIESGQRVSKQIVRERPDPLMGVITWESPIAQALSKAGGLHAEQGTVIRIHDRPTYELISIKGPEIPLT